MSTKREKKTERQTEEEIKEKQRKNRKVKLVPSIALSMFAGIGLALLLVVSARSSGERPAQCATRTRPTG